MATYEIGIGSYTDLQLLDWAANEDRVILTHDAKTFPVFAFERMEKEEKMSGVIVVPEHMPIGQAIDELELIILGRFENEWENNVTRLPL